MGKHLQAIFRIVIGITVGLLSSTSTQAITIESFQELDRFYRGRIRSIEWSPDGSQLAVAGDYRVWTYNRNAELEVQSSNVTLLPNSLAWNSEGSRFVFSDYERDAQTPCCIRILDTSTGDVVKTLRLPTLSTNPNNISWRPGSDQIAAVSADEDIVILDTSSSEIIGRLPSDGSPHGVVWNSDGSCLGVIGQNVVEIKCGDLASGSTTNETTIVGRIIEWNPDDTILAVANGSEIDLWDMQTLEILRIFDTFTDFAGDISWSPDGRFIAAVDGYKTVHVWNVETGELVQTFDDFCGACLVFPNTTVLKIDWNPQAQLLAVATADSKIHLLDPLSGELVNKIVHVDSINTLSWSANNQHIATNSTAEEILLWSNSTGETTGILDGHPFGVRDVAFNPVDSRFLASGGNDGTVRIWDIETGQLRVEFGESSDVYHNANSTAPTGVHQIDWDANGGYIAASYDSGIVRVWDVPTNIGDLDYWQSNISISTYDLASEIAYRGDFSPITPRIAIAWAPLGISQTAFHEAIIDEINLFILQPRQIGVRQLPVLAVSIYSTESITWSPDGTRIVSSGLLAGGHLGDFTILWNVQPTEVGGMIDIHEIEPMAQSVWHPFEQVIAGIDYPGSRMLIIDMENAEPLQILESSFQNFGGNPPLLQVLDWSPDGSHLATGDEEGFIIIWGN